MSIFAPPGVGTVAQVVNTTTTAVATGTTLLPFDDTIPQNTEGDQYMTLAITPKSTTNTLVIQVTATLSSSVVNNLSMALFQDSTANALAATDQFIATGTAVVNISLSYTMAAGTTSATTFKIRAGGSLAGTTTFNGTNAVRLFSTIAKSSIVIWEYIS